ARWATRVSLLERRWPVRECRAGGQPAVVRRRVFADAGVCQLLLLEAQRPALPVAVRPSATCLVLRAHPPPPVAAGNPAGLAVCALSPLRKRGRGDGTLS